jgi:hypothetical protein
MNIDTPEYDILVAKKTLRSESQILSIFKMIWFPVKGHFIGNDPEFID